MDLLTHLFLPLTVAYVLWPDRFESPAYLSLGALGVLADFDKFLRMPGLGHSLLTLAPVCAAMLLAEYRLRGRLWLSPVAVGLVASHLVLDFVGGSQVPLLYPVVEQGVALTYPGRTVFGTAPTGVTVEGPAVALKTASPNPDNATYGFIRGAGVSSALAFLAIYLMWNRRGTADPAPSGNRDAVASPRGSVPSASAGEESGSVPPGEESESVPPDEESGSVPPGEESGSASGRSNRESDDRPGE